jgi:hypothetical protein
MTWSKLPDDATETLWDLSAGAFRLHVSGLVYCNRHLTDGHVPASRLPALTPSYDVVHLDELVAARLWETVDGGYSIAGFLEDQPSRAQVEARRAAWTERQGRHRHGVTPGTGVKELRSSPFPDTASDTRRESRRDICSRCGGAATGDNPLQTLTTGTTHRFSPCPPRGES